MSPQNRLNLFFDATLALVMVDPNVLTDYARKVVADPAAHPPRTVELARAVLREEEAQSQRQPERVRQ